MADPVFVDNVTPLDAVSMNKLQTRDEKGAVNGYPSLGADGKVPLAQLPPVGGADLSFDGDWAAGTYQDGDVVVYNGIAYLCVGGPTAVAPDPAIWGIAGPSAGISYGTTLPVAPVDGQEAILVDSVTNPSYQWRFRYNAGSTSPYKWEFIGGAPARAEIVTGESTSSASYVDLATVGPTVVVPREGDYRCEFGCQSWNSVATQGAAAALKNGAIATADAQAVWSSTNAVGLSTSVARALTLAGVLAGATLKLQYKSTSGAGNFSNRWLHVIPARVQ